MKRQLLSLVALFAGVGVTFAQPTFNSTNEAAIGTSFSYYVGDTTGMDLKESTNGANATWDWSNLGGNITVTDRTADVQDAAGDLDFTPLGATQNFNIQDYLNQYSNYNATVKHSQGFRYSTAGSELAVVKFDTASYNMLEYPFDYTDVINNTISCIASINLQGNVYSDPNSSGTGYIEYDGHGTLMLPDTTFTNVARIHQRDSVHAAFTFPINDVDFVVNKYEFYDLANSDVPIFICSEVKIYNALFALDPVKSAYSIVPLSATASINENLAEKMNLEVYPNPAKDNLTIRFNADNGVEDQIKLVDLTGKTVKVIANGFSKGLNTFNVNVSDLPEGMYILEFIVGSETVSKKIVIQ